MVSFGCKILKERDVRHISSCECGAGRNGVEVDVNGGEGSLRLDCNCVGLEVSLLDLDLRVGNDRSTVPVNDFQ